MTGRINLRLMHQNSGLCLQLERTHLPETQNLEIQITNTYLEQTADLDLIKTSVSGTKFDGAEFKLYKKNDKGGI